MSVLRQCGAALGSHLVGTCRLSPWSTTSFLYVNQHGTVSTHTTDRPNTRGHKKFGHATEVTPPLTKYFHLIIGTLFIISITDFKKVIGFFTTKARADIEQKDTQLKEL